jgi:hypothetical protein
MVSMTNRAKLVCTKSAVMEKENSNNPSHLDRESNDTGNDWPGYPDYPESEDIYNICEEEKDIDPEAIFQKKESVGKYTPKRNSEMDLDSEFLGDDLDIPGAELDDNIENVGSEDEENNYYSLGGDNHENLEEDQGKEQDL